jgi:hypothetical protein
MFVRKPNRKEPKPAIAAVAVISDLCRSIHESGDTISGENAFTLNTDSILLILRTCRVYSGGVVAHAVSSSVSQDRSLVKLAVGSRSRTKTHIYSDNICHCEECCKAGSHFSSKPCVLDFLLLESALVAMDCEQAYRHTCPEPSRRKIRPNVDVPIFSLKASSALRGASMLSAFETGEYSKPEQRSGRKVSDHQDTL